MDDKFLEGLQQMIVDGVVEGTVEGITEELNKAIKESSSTINNKPYMNQKEVLDYVGISYPTLKKWMDAGLEFSLVNGTQYVFDKEDIAEFIKSHGVNHLNK